MKKKRIAKVGKYFWGDAEPEHSEEKAAAEKAAAESRQVWTLSEEERETKKKHRQRAV